MIHIRLKIFDNNVQVPIEIENGESLQNIYDRILGTCPIVEPKKVIAFFLNGDLVTTEWENTFVKSEDHIVLTPLISGEDNNIGRTAMMIAIVVAAAYTGGTSLGLSGWQLTAYTVAVTTAGSMWANSVFPPAAPNLAIAGIDSVEKSQMYSITGQSNQMTRMGFVPKVYGTQKMFPRVAANPYTRLESGPDGKISHYMYAIYDFGLGPAIVSDLKIGDTPLTNFEEVDYRFVDFHKPSISEGLWDDMVESELKYYKGDVTTVGVNVTLPDNENDAPTPPLVNYQATRTAANNLESLKQELNISLVAPQGLVSYGSNGSKGKVQVNFELEFAEEGTENWRAFNDLTYVSDFRTAGGGLASSDTAIKLSDDSLDYNLFVYGWTEARSNIEHAEYGQVCVEGGSSEIVIQNTGVPIAANTVLRIAGETIGVVDSTVNFTRGTRNYTRLILTSPIAKRVAVAEYVRLVTSGVYGNYFLQRIRPATIGIPINSKISISGTGDEAGPVYASFSFTPRAIGTFKIRLTRTDTYKAYTTEVVDTVTWSEIKTSFDSSPIATDKRHVFLELKIRATNQLNGNISNLSGVVSSVLEVYNGTSWVKQVSSNPAWVFADLLTGQVNKRAITKSRLDLPALKAWADFCDEVPTNLDGVWLLPRFQTNFILDFQTTLSSLIEKVTSVGQASMNIVDGKYGVLIDRKKTVPVQLFTPMNSSTFSSSRNFFTPPHALDVQFIDPTIDWSLNSVVIYADGYDEVTATEIEEVSTFAVTNVEQAWRFGRYLMAQSKLRQETITLDVDYEHLLCTRGDYVQVTQDSMAIGGAPARVKTVVGNTVTINDAVENIASDWVYVFRSTITGTIHQGDCTPIDSRTFTLAGDTMPLPEDLIVFGERYRVVFDCIVKSITPKDDYAATLTLVEKADAIHDSEIGIDLPDYNPQLSQIRSTARPPGPVEELLIVDAGRECQGDSYLYYIQLDWEPPTGSVLDFYEVYVNVGGQGYTLAGTTRNSDYLYLVDLDYLDLPHDFKVAGKSADGKMIELIAMPSVSYTPLTKTTPPSNVGNVSIDVVSDTLSIRWDKVDDCDIREYQIRYSPLMNGTWETSVFEAAVARDTSACSVSARTGTYLLKAIDFVGNESLVAARAITTVPELYGKNLLQTVSDTPTFLGVKDRVVREGSFLRLGVEVEGSAAELEYYEEGFYYYREVVDLGDIYTVRVNSYIQAEGFSASDVLASWVPLATAIPLSASTVSDWDVITEYRVSDQRNVIADWEKLTDISALSVGVVENYSEWRPFTAGDITGRVIQFRLRLKRYKKNVTPKVYDGTIVVDVPDREQRFDDMESPIGGLTLYYSPAFKGPNGGPNIQVTIENSLAGDNWEIYDRTLESFSIRFFDGAGNPVARRFDAVARGYGYRYTDII